MHDGQSQSLLGGLWGSPCSLCEEYKITVFKEVQFSRLSGRTSSETNNDLSKKKAGW